MGNFFHEWYYQYFAKHKRYFPIIREQVLFSLNFISINFRQIFTAEFLTQGVPFILCK